MVKRPLLLDLFCCEGGAATGYHRAGFDIIGVDIDPQPRYPFKFIQADWREGLFAVIDDVFDGRREVHAIHASPPCQRFSQSTQSTGTPEDHPDLIGPVRDTLDTLGIPYILENVERAPLRPDVTLCGSMFDMQVKRHRIFELGGWQVWGAPTCRHADMARRGPTVDVTGHAGGRNQTVRPNFPIKWHDVTHAQQVMGMPWASGRGCTEAIPPAYTEYLGQQLLDHLTLTAPCTRCNGHGKIACWGSAIHTLRCSRCHGTTTEPESETT